MRSLEFSLTKDRIRTVVTWPSISVGWLLRRIDILISRY